MTQLSSVHMNVWTVQDCIVLVHYSIGLQLCTSHLWIVPTICFGLGFGLLFTRREAIASPSIGFTLSSVSMVFVGSAITPPKVNRFGWNLGHLEYIVWCWPWQILGAIRAEARASERCDFFCFFCQVNNTRLYRFPVGQISRNLHTRRGSATWWILSERNFQNLPASGRFFLKRTFLICSRTISDFRRR